MLLKIKYYTAIERCTYEEFTWRKTLCCPTKWKRLKDTKLYKKLDFNYVKVCPEKVVGQE